MADQSPDNNIYTVLALVALLAVICGIVFIWIRTGDVFGTGSSPFSLEVAADTFRSLIRF
jgi:hypothetical protein